MEAIMRFSRDAMRQVMVALLGALFALGLFEIWNLDLRWFVVLVTAIVLVAIAMCFASVFSDFLLISFFFTLPFASFDKWFWTSHGASDRGSLVYGGVFGLGLLDFVLVGLYLSWFYRVFIVRIQPIPRLCFLDSRRSVLTTSPAAPLVRPHRNKCRFSGAPDIRVSRDVSSTFTDCHVSQGFCCRNVQPCRPITAD
jgi:hypothetical protein